jgi:hypothetical protein
MDVKKWVEEHLWNDEYFTPEKLGSKHTIYSSEYRSPLITSLIEGHGTKAIWKLSNERGLTESFFQNVKPLVSRYHASWFYVTNPDNVLSVFEWEKEIDSKSFNANELKEFEKNPAKEGGSMYIGILLHSLDGLILFELSHIFEISFYGTDMKWNDLKNLLGMHI